MIAAICQSIETHYSKLAVVGEFYCRRLHMTIELSKTLMRGYKMVIDVNFLEVSGNLWRYI